MSSWFLQHLPIILVLSLLVFLLFTLIGWFLWRNRKAKVAEIEAENERLRKEHEALETERKALERALA